VAEQEIADEPRLSFVGFGLNGLQQDGNVRRRIADRPVNLTSRADLACDG